MGWLAAASGGIAGQWMRRLAVQMAVAWVALHLLVHQSGVLGDGELRQAPVETSLARAGVHVDGAELTLVWEEPPGPPLSGSPADFFYLEGRVHGWMATLGRGLGIPRWRVLERREGTPYLLGLGGRSTTGVGVEVWVYGPEPPVAGLPTGQRGGLAVRFTVDGTPTWEERLAKEWLPVFPAEWLSGSHRPQALVRWRLSWEEGESVAMMERIAQALSARVHRQKIEGNRSEVWLASPRGAPFPAWARRTLGVGDANVLLTWGAGLESGGDPLAYGEPHRLARGRVPHRQRAELLASPSPLSGLGRVLLEAWRGDRSLFRA